MDGTPPEGRKTQVGEEGRAQMDRMGLRYLCHGAETYRIRGLQKGSR